MSNWMRTGGGNFFLVLLFVATVGSFRVMPAADSTSVTPTMTLAQTNYSQAIHDYLTAKADWQYCVGNLH